MPCGPSMVGGIDVMHFFPSKVCSCDTCDVAMACGCILYNT
jgi:hypothetical protein